MTNREALHILKSITPASDNDKVFQALQVGIKALEYQSHTGYWIKHIYGGQPVYECYLCQCLEDKMSDFCPNCGAVMEV